jgi:hypothetical protein
MNNLKSINKNRTNIGGIPNSPWHTTPLYYSLIRVHSIRSRYEFLCCLLQENFFNLQRPKVQNLSLEWPSHSALSSAWNGPAEPNYPPNAQGLRMCYLSPQINIHGRKPLVKSQIPGLATASCKTDAKIPPSSLCLTLLYLRKSDLPTHAIRKA